MPRLPPYRLKKEAMPRGGVESVIMRLQATLARQNAADLTRKAETS
jgi:hypothetical protein